MGDAGGGGGLQYKIRWSGSPHWEDVTWSRPERHEWASFVGIPREKLSRRRKSPGAEAA